MHSFYGDGLGHDRVTPALLRDFIQPAVCAATDVVTQFVVIFSGNLTAVNTVETTAAQLIGTLAFSAGLVDTPGPISAAELASVFSWEKLGKEDIYLDAKSLF